MNTEKENPSHSYSEGADAPLNPQVDVDQRLFNFLYDHGFKSLHDDREEIRNIVTADLRAQLAAAEKTVHDHGIRLNNYAHFFEAMRGLVLNEFNQITDADNPYQALERAFDRLSIR